MFRPRLIPMHDVTSAVASEAFPDTFSRSGFIHVVSATRHTMVVPVSPTQWEVPPDGMVFREANGKGVAKRCSANTGVPGVTSTDNTCSGSLGT